MTTKTIHMESIHGLHNFMIHNPERDVNRMLKMVKPSGKPRYHKFIVHGNKCDWLPRLSKQDRFIIRNVDISEEPMHTTADAEMRAEEHFKAHLAYAQDAESKGVPRSSLIFEGRNEPQPDEPLTVIGHYEATRLRLCAAEHLVCSICNYGEGNQSTYKNDPKAAPDWDDLNEAHLALIQYGGFLGMHFYWGSDGPNAVWPDSKDMRWPQQGFRGLQCPWQDIRIIISEGGLDEGVNGVKKWGWHFLVFYGPKLSYDQAAVAYLAMLVWAEQMYLRDPRIVAFIPFTNDYENNEWDKFDNTPTQLMNPLDAHILAGVDVIMWGDEYIAKWQPIIEYRAAQVGLDPKVVAAIVKLESNGVVDAYGAAGDTGLMQVIDGEHMTGRPSHAELLNPDQNVKTGCSILAGNLAYFKGDLTKAIAAYNLGCGSIDTYGTGGPLAQKYLGAFRIAWNALWGGVCPIDAAVPPVAPTVTPTPVVGLSDVLLAAGQVNQSIRLNPTAALQKQILADGFVPDSGEFDVTVGNVAYRCQRAERLSDGLVRVYYCVVPNWADVSFFTK